MHRFKIRTVLILIAFFGSAISYADTAGDFKKTESGLYKDVFDQEVYYQGTQYLHLERLYRGLFNKEKHALDVNAFDEVPDSNFFINRHGKTRMSIEELKRGPLTAGASYPESSDSWTITKGKFGGITPGFFVHNEKGDKYLLKFDPLDYPELATGAEVIASHFMHAFGYSVPSYSIVNLKKNQLALQPGAQAYDETGFRKELTPERLESFLIFIPETDEGTYRASASRIISGKILGPMKLQGRRSDDPEDKLNHEDRREIRALNVFASWLNNIDVRESNTLDVVEETDGRPLIRHYFIDFNSSFGATPRGAKPPQFGHEHMVDYKEIFKAILGLGFWKRSWEKRWEESGPESPSSFGYFDNRYFKPELFKAQLPYFHSKDLTRADGFWAAKVLMRFTNEEIEAVVATGNFSDKAIEKKLTKTLIERRDIIGRYWFERANPLDGFKLVQAGGAYELHFEDLAVRYGFERSGESVYHVKVIGKTEKKGITLAEEEIQGNIFKINPEWFVDFPSLDLLIRTQRPGDASWSPRVRVEVRSEGGSARLVGILHED